MISEMVASESLGNASLMSGRAGATAAPPMRISVQDSRMKASDMRLGAAFAAVAGWASALMPRPPGPPW